MTSQYRPIVLLGIDGATYSILDPLMNEGKLPNLTYLKKQGAWGILQSTIHPLTPAAWVSMVTGLNPGKHGLYDFRRRKSASYDWELVNSNSWSGSPIWSILSQEGKKVGIFNVPMTYPPHPVNGFMISGLGTPPKSQNFIYPDHLAVKFQKHFPTYAIEPDAATNDLHEYFQRIHQLTKQRVEALRFLLHKYPDLDFFMPVFIETDRIHHVYWRFMDPDMPDYHAPIAAEIREQATAVYQYIDTVLGELWSWVVDHQGYLVVASDHGFGPLLKDVYMNKWLNDHGYLTLKIDEASRSPERFFEQIDWNKTVAYSFGFFGNINLNLHGREPRGIVEPGREAELLKQKIISQLKQLTDPETNEVIVDTVYRKEELYSGTFLDQAPDLIVIMKDYAYMTRDGFDFKSNQLVGRPMEHHRNVLPHSGNHRLEGILLLAGEGIKPGSKIDQAIITDIAPTLLYLAGSPIPTGLDGHALLKIFDETFVANNPPTYTSPASDGVTATKPLKTQLLEKNVQISLLNEEVRRLQDEIIQKNQIIYNLEDLVRRFRSGRIIRLLAWLHRIKTNWQRRAIDS